MYDDHLTLSGWAGLNHADTGLRGDEKDSYVNASLQVLFHSPLFVRCLSTDFEAHVQSCEDGRCLLCCLWRVWMNLQNGVSRTPSELSEMIGASSMGSSYDVVMNLITHLHYKFEEESHVVAESAADVIPTPIMAVFGGLLLSTSECCRCGAIRSNECVLICLQLCIDGKCDLQTAINDAFQSKRLKESPCSECHCTTFIKRTEVAKSPNVLLVRLVRTALTEESFTLCDSINTFGEHYYKFSGATSDSTAIVRCPNDFLKTIHNMRVTGLSWVKFLQPSFGGKCDLLVFEKVQKQVNPPQKLKKSPWKRKSSTQENPDTEWFSSPQKLKDPPRKRKTSTPLKENQDTEWFCSPASCISTLRSWTVTPQEIHLVQTHEGDPSGRGVSTPQSSSVRGRLKPRSLDFNSGRETSEHVSAITPTSEACEQSFVAVSEPQRSGRKRSARKNARHMKSVHMRRREPKRVTVKYVVLRSIVDYETCVKDEKTFTFFTGLSPTNFGALYELIGGHEVISKLKLTYAKRTPKRSRSTGRLTSRNKLFMFLVRLRRGVPIVDLAYIFGIGPTYASLLVYSMLRLVFLTFKALERRMFLSAEAQLKGKPLPFRPFRNLRVIIDGAEFFIHKPSNFMHQGNTHSDYKAHNTFRVIIGISCYGAIMFVSPGYEGNMSEKQALIESGFFDYLQPGDAVMCDRGFEIQDELMKRGVEVIKPPSLGGREFFTPEEEVLTKAIASARIYVEHAVKVIKDNRLIRFCTPLTMLPTLSDYIYVAGYLGNFGKKNIKPHKKRS